MNFYTVALANFTKKLKHFTLDSYSYFNIFALYSGS